jgi:hypothetical protein
MVVLSSFSEKNYISRNNSRIFMFECTTVLYVGCKWSRHWIFMKLYTFVVHYLQMCMKENGCCPKFKMGDNSTYTFTKRGGVFVKV